MESKNPEPPDGNSVVLPVASAPATEPLDYSIAMNSAPQAGASAIEGSPDAAVSASQPSEPSFVTSSTTSRNSVVPPDMKPWEFWMIFVGLGLAVFLAALDQTIVSVAIPSIVTEFQTVTGIAWVGIGYFITAVPLIPTYGLLSDILGRKFVYLAAIFFFELGSLICGVAPSMTVLILGRAVAGLGGGAILSLSLIIIADYVAIEKRGLFAGVIGACFAIASVVGPLLGASYERQDIDFRLTMLFLPGGVFTEQLTWR